MPPANRIYLQFGNSASIEQTLIYEYIHKEVGTSNGFKCSVGDFGIGSINGYSSFPKIKTTSSG